MNWSSHSPKIANKTSLTLGIMNRLKRYLPTSAMKLMYDSLVLSHLQFGITCWGFEWERIFKLQKCALRIMTNSKDNAHTDPIFKGLEMLKVKDIFDVHCLKLWYKFVNSELPYFLKSMYTYNHELYETETRSHGMFHLYPTRTAGACKVVRHRIPVLLLEFSANLMGKVRTHSISTLFLMSSLIWLAHIPLSAFKWTVIYVSVTRNNYGMLIICMKRVLRI